MSDQNLTHSTLPMQLSGSKTADFANLDHSASHRQAFGGLYGRPRDLEKGLSNYWSGNLVLQPQPVWKGDFTNWIADPFQDRNWKFQHHTLRWLNPLRWAAVEGDERAKTEWLRVARSWGEANVPASATKSDFAWKDMADGNRAIQLCVGAPLVDPQEEWFTSLLQYHRDWLMNPKHIVGKNHGLHQHQGLLVLGAVLRDREAVDTAVRRMSAQFETAFDVQGTNNEGSSAYHQMNISWWSLAWQRAKLEGIEPPRKAQERLAAAAEVLAHVALPDGQIPQIGDSKRMSVQTGFAPSTDFVATGGKQGVAPIETVKVLDRGYITSRSGWGNDRPLEKESHMLIKYGEDHKGHSHNDRGSVNIYTQGQRWLIDSGFHSYQIAIPEVRYLKSREAHNLASIVGAQHDADSVVELVSSEVNEKFHEFVLVDRGYGKKELVRRVVYFVDADCWIVSDRLISTPRAQITQSWQVEPGVKTRTLDNGFRLYTKTDNFSMFWLGKETALKRTSPTEESLIGWVGTKWKTMLPGTRITATSNSVRPHIVSLFGARNPRPLSIIESHVAVNGTVMTHIARGESQWRMTISDDGISLQDNFEYVG